MKKLKKPLIFIALTIIILIANKELKLSAYLSDVDTMKKLLENNFKSALLIYITVTVFSCTILALPGITFAIIAGIIFGPWWGSLACLIATTLGASLAFLIGRYFLKDSLKPILEKNQALKKLLFTKGQNDITLLMITRLIPIFPYNIQNFAYGITDIGFWKYTLLTFIFMIPGVGIYTIGSAGIVAENNNLTYILFSGALLITLSTIAIKIKKKYLEKTRCIILFTRIPSKNKGKTRLKTHLTGEQCEQLQQNFIKDTYQTLKTTGEQIIIIHGNEEKEDKIKTIIKDELSYIPQQGENIGQKMANAFQKVFQQGYNQAILIGSDIPHLEKTDLQTALNNLDKTDITINPTKDGGYYLIGINKLNKNKIEKIFQTEKNGTKDAYKETINNLKTMKLTISTGKENFDIDTWEDLKTLEQHLKTNTTSCQNTKNYIKQIIEQEEHETINHSTNI